jgi:ComF family protein
MAFLNPLLDLLYPPKCVCCSSMQDWWCVTCRSAVETLAQQPCARCLSLEAGHDAASCAGELPFTGVVATGFYHSPPLRRLVGSLKYDGVTASAQAVEEYLRTTYARLDVLPWEHESSLMIHPMPLSVCRERERGFNQAAWLAERFRVAWNIRGDMADCLIRARGSMAQADVAHNLRLRRANVQGQFRCSIPVFAPMLLVDDVVTTGSTAAEAARALLRAGASRVYLLALALGK